MHKFTNVHPFMNSGNDVIVKNSKYVFWEDQNIDG